MGFLSMISMGVAGGSGNNQQDAKKQAEEEAERSAAQLEALEELSGAQDDAPAATADAFRPTQQAPAMQHDAYGTTRNSTRSVFRPPTARRY
jgi:hypothetical protein